MKAWSYSMLTAFETCPHQFYRVRVLKDVVEEQGEAALWGDRVHKALENRVRDQEPLPEWAAQWEVVWLGLQPAEPTPDLPGQAQALRRAAQEPEGPQGQKGHRRRLVGHRAAHQHVPVAVS